MFEIDSRQYAGTRTNPLPIGRRGEHLVRYVIFDLTKFRERLGEGTWAIVAQRKNDVRPYECTNTGTSQEGYAVWFLTEVDTNVDGLGEVELRYYPTNDVTDDIAKTQIWVTYCARSLGVPGNVPTPWEDIIDQMANYVAQAEDEVSKAQDEVERAQSAAVRAEEAAEEAASVITGDVTKAVRWDVSQLLSDTEKATARSNISAAYAIKESASGKIASFEDGANDYSMDSLVANIEPVQDLHGYDHPFPPGWF